MNSLRATVARVHGSLQLALLILGTFFVLSPQTRAQNVVYATTNTSAFGTLNLDTGAFTQLGTSQTQLAGLGELGAFVYSGVLGQGGLYQLNLSNGSVTLIASNNLTVRSFGATIAGNLYAITSDGILQLWSLVGGGSVSDLGRTGLGAGTLAMSANGVALYATLDPGTGSVLYSLDTSTGAASMIGLTGVANITSLVFRHGTLYAATAGGNIYTVNPQTGQATYHATTSVAAVGMAAPASIFSVLHTFGESDGAAPEAGLTMDRSGNLYGTTDAGGTQGDGTVFKLTNHSGSWIFTSLYSFQFSGGANPLAPVTIASDGTLFGTTSYGGNDFGTVFRLHPPAAFCRSVDCAWGEQTIYVSPGGTNPAGFGYGALVFDATGNIYGTSSVGGTHQIGTVFELTSSGGHWSESTLYNFGSQNQDGSDPLSGVIFDNSGNLYGTTANGGGANAGTVYEISPSGGSWTENILHSFAGSDGQYPMGGLMLDGVNKLYGTTIDGGANGGGTVYQLTKSDGAWSYGLIYSFPAFGGGYSSSPAGSLIMDAAGNLYGTALAGGRGAGSIFELTPSNGGWIYTELYEFTNGNDGAKAWGSLVFDSAGNLYGTAQCANGNCGQSGTVYKLTPQ